MCHLRENRLPLGDPFRHWRNLENGVLPYDGGYEAQPSVYQEAMTLVSILNHERELSEIRDMHRKSKARA